MVRKETVVVAFMACLLLVASFTVCAHATEGRRMLASENVYYPQGGVAQDLPLGNLDWSWVTSNTLPLAYLGCGVGCDGDLEKLPDSSLF
ncbi:hypothetical protein DKX38_023316 [Salix brachista]|uniref:Uncharacterized protein n=1 Tax=Salix brachista TaxID=2182728 RepID=A0A5N5JWD0_9ROSI|nr:hypothetical protein DKX38_023316 [Salix brachista]